MKKILIIEDEASLQSVLKDAIENLGYKVFQAFTAEGGIKELENNAPDMIVLDIMLPGNLDGFGFLEIVKNEKKFQNIPVLVLTNLEDEEDTAKKYQVQGYLVKANEKIDDIIAYIKDVIGPADNK